MSLDLYVSPEFPSRRRVIISRIWRVYARTCDRVGRSLIGLSIFAVSVIAALLLLLCLNHMAQSTLPEGHNLRKLTNAIVNVLDQPQLGEFADGLNNEMSRSRR